MTLTFHFTLILSGLILGGCFAHKFSSPLLPFKEDGKTTAAFQDIVVAIAAPASESHELTKLIDALQKAQFFKEAGSIDQLSRPPDLILDSWVYEGERDPFENCSLGFEGEMLTIGTAGLIPQVCERRHSVAFDLYSSKKQENPPDGVHLRNWRRRRMGGAFLQCVTGLECDRSRSAIP